jgi:hypothetical protein
MGQSKKLSKNGRTVFRQFPPRISDLVTLKFVTPSKNEGWQRQGQIAATDGGTSLWDHQERDGIPAISPARAGKSRAGMAVGLHRLQPQAAAYYESGTETGWPSLKTQEKEPGGTQTAPLLDCYVT